MMIFARKPGTLCRVRGLARSDILGDYLVNGWAVTGPCGALQALDLGHHRLQLPGRFGCPHQITRSGVDEEAPVRCPNPRRPGPRQVLSKLRSPASTCVIAGLEAEPG